MSELMPFGGNNLNRIRRKMQSRKLARKASKRIFGLLGRYGVSNVPRLILAIVALVVFVASFSMAIFSIGLPNPSRLVIYEATESTKVFDRNGEVLYDIFNEKRRSNIEFDDIPEVIKQATIAIEDKNFYHHGGFDITGFLRGLILQPLRGKGIQGGSTITQQFVKNALLGPEREISRKIRELILSFELEQIYSKDKILSLYLNEVPYGSGGYGVQAATEIYFGKDVSEITLPEAAVLAALPQAPSRYSPYGQNPDLLMARKDIVLEQMYKQGYITSDEAEAAQSAEIEFQPRSESIRAPHFVMYVREQLAAKYGEKMVEEGGLKITTSLDWNKQKAAETAISSRAEYNMERYNAGNAALVSIDPNTGEILAMVGSKDYFDMEEDGQVNVTIRERQPGSSIKPIVYATAFKKGYSPATMLMDTQTNFGQGWTPNNYDGVYRGPLSIRDALQGSINVVAVKALAYAGVRETTNVAHDMGITSLNDPERYGLSLTLGGGEVTLLDLTAAYGVFAANGMRSPVVSILKVEDKNGRVLEEYKPVKPRRAIDAQVAYLISDVLSDDAARAKFFGAGSQLTLPGRTVAAKTGTTNEYRDGWTIGYTPDLVTGVWVGNNDNESMTNGAGLSVAAPIWNRYMRSALASTSNKAFTRPSGIREIEVDVVSGMLPTEDSPGTKTEIFTSFAVPTKSDDIHTKVRVVISAPDKLAPDSFPIDLTEERVFDTYYSERPNNSNWENSVINWAKENGHNNIPTEYYGGSADDIERAVVMHFPGQSSFPISLIAHLSEEGLSKTFEKIEFYLDNVLVGSKDSGGPQFTLDIDEGATGEHTVYTKLIATEGNFQSSTINFTTI